MRLKGILLTILLVTTLMTACASVNFSPIFDLSKWSMSTYPTFDASTLHDANMPALPSFTGIQGISYKPVFDMSPCSWNFNSFVKISGD